MQKPTLKDSLKYGLPGIIGAGGAWLAAYVASKKGKNKILFGALAGVIGFIGSYYALPTDYLADKILSGTKKENTEETNEETK